MSRRLLRRTPFALALGMASLACGGNGLERLREHTYPPTFNYIPHERLTSTMWALADHVSRLDAVMRDTSLADEARQQQVVAELTAMDATAEALGPGDWPSNHPKVSRNIERFRADVELARHAAQMSPPNYFLAGSIAGACLNCHGAE
jgi:cytochrome c553